MIRLPHRRLALDALGIYAASRLTSLAWLLLVEDQLRGSRFPGGPPFRLWVNVLARWDAAFYRMVAVEGYPASLPLDAAGTVQPNTWAFYPVFPMLARLVANATGLTFEPAAVILNVLAGAVAAVLLAVLVRRYGDDHAALRAVGLWACFPTAFVLQVPYSEACYSALAAGCLIAIVSGRFGLAALLLIGTSLTRGFVLPLSAAGLVGVACHWRAGHRAKPWTSMVLIGSALAAPWMWMTIAAVVTGRPDAYAVTQEVWGFAFDPAVWVARWRDALPELGRDWYFTAIVGGLGAACALTGFAWRSRLPLELKAYAAVALMFLLLLSQPGAVAFTSVPRFLFGVLTIPIVLGLRLSNVAAAACACAGMALQYWWILNVWSGRMGVAP